INQELKDLKKKLELSEEELIKTKKNSSKEISDLQNYYDQRILCSLKTIMNYLNKTDAERYNIIHDMLQNMQKRFENNNVCMFCFDVKENSLSDSLSVDDNSTIDPDWSKTPIHRRPRPFVTKDYCFFFSEPNFFT
ncbi:hypothetical protein BpHYR1_020509, partial [Brachionus plicatilis]